MKRKSTIKLILKAKSNIRYFKEKNDPYMVMVEESWIRVLREKLKEEKGVREIELPLM